MPNSFLTSIHSNSDSETSVKMLNIYRRIKIYMCKTFEDIPIICKTPSVHMFTSLRSFGLSMVEKVTSCMGLKWQTRKLLYVAEKQVTKVRVTTARAQTLSLQNENDITVHPQWVTPGCSAEGKIEGRRLHSCKEITHDSSHTLAGCTLAREEICT